MTRRQARAARAAELGAGQGMPPVVSDADVISLRRNTIGTQVRSVLRKEIISGRLPPRTMLSEQDLGSRFGVSRTPIREALIKLSEEGLVEIYPQYGSFVAPIKLSDVFDSQFTREALECAAVEKAVGRIAADGAKNLQRTLDRQRAAIRIEDQQEFFRADEDMHACIMDIAGHGSAWHYVENAKAQMDRVRFLSMAIPRKLSLVLAEHVAIVDSLVAQNRTDAVGAMRAHLQGIFRSVEILAEQKNNYFVERINGPKSLPSRVTPPGPDGAARRRPRTTVKSRVK
jgi:DNA-binding GntR family transcriptional regulator